MLLKPSIRTKECKLLPNIFTKLQFRFLNAFPPKNLTSSEVQNTYSPTGHNRN